MKNWHLLFLIFLCIIWHSWFNNVPVIKHHVIFLSPWFQNFTIRDLLFQVLYGIPMSKILLGNVVGKLFALTCLTPNGILWVAAWKTGLELLRGKASGNVEGFCILLYKNSEMWSHLWLPGTYMVHFLAQIQFQTFYPLVLISRLIPLRSRVQKRISIYFKDYCWSTFLWSTGEQQMKCLGNKK